MGDLAEKWPLSSGFSRKLQMSEHSDITIVVDTVSSSVPGQKILAGTDGFTAKSPTFDEHLLYYKCSLKSYPESNAELGGGSKWPLAGAGNFSYIHGDFPALCAVFPMTMIDGHYYTFALWIGPFTPWSVLLLQTQKPRL